MRDEPGNLRVKFHHSFYNAKGGWISHDGGEEGMCFSWHSSAARDSPQTRRKSQVLTSWPSSQVIEHVQGINGGQTATGTLTLTDFHMIFSAVIPSPPHDGQDGQ